MTSLRRIRRDGLVGSPAFSPVAIVRPVAIVPPGAVAQRRIRGR